MRANVLNIFAACCALAGTTVWAGNAAAPIALTIDARSPGYAIPPDFVGLSFETASVLLNRYGISGHFLSPANTQLITLIRNIGVKNIRVGGGTSDTGGRGGMCVSPVVPTIADIDDLFGFARAVGVNVTYSLRLLNPDACYDAGLPAADAATARYIRDHYRPNLRSFSIGNEPDWHSYHTYSGHSLDSAIFETISGTPGSAYPSFLEDWRKFAEAIRIAVPDATFSSPDTGSYTTLTYTPDPATGVSWTGQFAKDEQGSGLLAEATQHHYVGANPGETTAQQAIDNMLSPAWVNGTSIGTQPAGTNGTTSYIPYPWIYDNILAPVASSGVHYRMTEANDYLRGVAGASNAFSAALWALDYLHWWAAHGAAGINFHNNPWLLTDTIVPNPIPCPETGCTDYQVTPKGYGMKAFALGSRGRVEPVAIRNPDGINVTAYAAGDARNVYVTVINKTHSADATDANVTIAVEGFAASGAACMVLTDGEPGNASLLTATLGGAGIANDAPWQGEWTRLTPDRNGDVTLTVEAATAAIVRIHARPAGIRR